MPPRRGVGVGHPELGEGHLREAPQAATQARRVRGRVAQHAARKMRVMTKRPRKEWSKPALREATAFGGLKLTQQWSGVAPNQEAVVGNYYYHLNIIQLCYYYIITLFS